MAWIDGEISLAEASEITRHVAACADCRNCAAELRTVSGSFEEYCDAVLRASARREASRRKPVLLAAAAAIILALVVTHGRQPVTARVPTPSETASVATPVTAVQTSVASLGSREKRNGRRDHYRSARATAPLQARAQTQSEPAASVEPAVRIAIPADAIFAPGAVPEGINFVADLSIGADGSVQRVRLQPQISEVERRPSQP